MRHDAPSEPRQTARKQLSRLLQLVEGALPHYAYAWPFCPSYRERMERESSTRGFELERFRRW